MNHGLKLHPDGTLELTMPKDKKITRVLVCQAGTQNGKLYYPERDVPDTNVGNLVNRQDAIDVARKCPVKEVTPAYMLIDKAEAMRELMMLPSAEPEKVLVAEVTLTKDQIQDAVDKAVEKIRVEMEWPERKKGKWIDKSDGIEDAWNYCSICGEQAIDLYDFCPNCGADMRGTGDNSDE